mgnify:CR=1 FL=1
MRGKIIAKIDTGALRCEIRMDVADQLDGGH